MTDKELMIELMKRSSMAFMEHRVSSGDDPMVHDRCEKVAHNIINILPNKLTKGMVDELANHARVIYGECMSLLNENDEEYYEMLVKIAHVNQEHDE